MKAVQSFTKALHVRGFESPMFHEVVEKTVKYSQNLYIFFVQKYRKTGEVGYFPH